MKICVAIIFGIENNQKNGDSDERQREPFDIPTFRRPYLRQIVQWKDGPAAGTAGTDSTTCSGQGVCHH
jgi:hypothetical protein